MYTIDDLLEVMARLRDPESGCPWDLAQTLKSIVPHTLEEAYEVAETIERDDSAALCDELGDLLFQIVFYARIAEEEGDFAFGDVVDAICRKLIRRHPHVFADERVSDVADQTRQWEAHKQKERAAKQGGRPPGMLDDISLALPALSRAQKIQRRAAHVGFDWPDTAGVKAKLAEELAELDEAVEAGRREDIEAEVGDLLFTCVNLARHLEVDAEAALRGATRRFARRFAHMEAAAGSGEGLAGLDAEARERLWRAAKRGMTEEGRPAP